MQTTDTKAPFAVKKHTSTIPSTAPQQHGKNEFTLLNWHICAQRTAMHNQQQVEQVETALQVHHLPEMIFDSKLVFTFKPKNFVLQFCALDALALAKSNVLLPFRETYLPSIKVGHAWDQEKKKKDFALLKQQSDTTTTATATLVDCLEEREDNIDWTFTTIYKGTTTGDSCKIEETDEKIDYNKLKKKDTILFYDDLMLFEDELHDNGISTYSVKTRVMPECFFILLRLYLRVDGVLVRMIDTRFYHEFGQPCVLRDFTVRQATYEKLGKMVTNDVKLISDAVRMEPLLPLQVQQVHKIFV